MCSEKCDEDEFGIIEIWIWMMEIKGKRSFEEEFIDKKSI